MEASPERGDSHSSGHKEAGITVSAAFGIINAPCVEGLVAHLVVLLEDCGTFKRWDTVEEVKALGACLYCLSSLR